MAKINCQYSQYKKVGLEQSLTCSLTGKYCTKQRYCPTQRRLVNTDDWQTCTQLKKEELQMANKKNTKKANVTKTVPVEETVETKVVEESIIETEEKVSAIEVEKEPKVVEIKEDFTKYEIILATPSYYIINRDGKNITIKEINNYKKGDIVTL